MISTSMGYGAKELNRAGMGAIKGICGLGAGVLHGSIPGPPYCTDLSYDQLLAMYGVENCTTYDVAGDVAGSAACVARNADKLVQVSQWQNGCSYPPSYGNSVGAPFTAQVPGQGGNMPYGGPSLVQAWEGSGTTNLGVTAPTNSGSPGTGGSSGGTGTFYNTSTGNASFFYLNDNYTLKISGAKPNTAVVVNSVHNGNPANATMGTTDGSGNWSISGTMDSSSVVGTWSEVWTVGGVTVLSINFTVGPTAGVFSPSASSYTNPAIGTSSGATNTTNTTNTTAPVMNQQMGNTTPPLSNQPSSGGGNNFLLGLESIFNPGSWGQIFSSGDISAILGLATPILVGGFLLMGHRR